MAAKKNPGRFTIQFNVGDPQQQEVCNFLEQQGRHKAQFLTTAVLHYIHCPETPDISSPSLIDSALLEKMVLSILEQHDSNISASAPASDEVSSEKAGQANIYSDDALCELLGNQGLSAIQSTLSAFQHG